MTDAEKVILSRNKTYYQNIWECFMDRRKSLSKALTKALKGGYDVNFIPRGSLRKPILLVVLGHTGKSEAKDVKLLLDAGADVNLTDLSGLNALMTAVSFNWDIGIIKEILTKTKNINVVTQQENNTALGLLCQNILQQSYLFTPKNCLSAEDKSLIKDFLDAGADPDIDGKWKKPDYCYVTKDNQKELQKSMLAYIEKYRERKESLKFAPESIFEYEL